MTKLARMFSPPMTTNTPPIVARTPAHEQTEALLASLRRRRKEAGDRLDEMYGFSPERQQAVAAYEKLNAEIRQVRTALAPHRNRHLEATRKAFRQPRRDAAKRALVLIAEIERTVDELNVMSAELRRLGGVHPDLPASKILQYLVLPLQPLAREKGEAS